MILFPSWKEHIAVQSREGKTPKVMIWGGLCCTALYCMPCITQGERCWWLDGGRGDEEVRQT